MFRHNSFGAIVANKPKEAQAKLAKVYEKERSLAGVARAMKVDVRTVARWANKLVEKDGLEDPFGRARPSSAA